jgi:hypothetical protein
MAIHFVENIRGRAQVCWPGALLLLSAAFLACAAIPAGSFWLAFGDGKLVTTTLAAGFGVACLLCVAILGRSLRLPIDGIPSRSAVVRPDRRRLLIWEARWIPVEILGMGFGLFLGLRLENWGTASFLLFSVVCLSFVVRCWHYAGTSARTGTSKAEPGAAADRGSV